MLFFIARAETETCGGLRFMEGRLEMKGKRSLGWMVAVLLVFAWSDVALAQYHAGLGRFLQRDPTGYADGRNVYEFVGGNPVGFGDSSGLLQYDLKVFRRLCAENGIVGKQGLQMMHRAIEKSGLTGRLSDEALEAFIKGNLDNMGPKVLGKTKSIREYRRAAKRGLKGGGFGGGSASSFVFGAIGGALIIIVTSPSAADAAEWPPAIGTKEWWRQTAQDMERCVNCSCEQYELEQTRHMVYERGGFWSPVGDWKWFQSNKEPGVKVAMGEDEMPVWECMKKCETLPWSGWVTDQLTPEERATAHERGSFVLSRRAKVWLMAEDLVGGRGTFDPSLMVNGPRSPITQD